jgi:hypothetical protein
MQYIFPDIGSKFLYIIYPDFSVMLAVSALCEYSATACSFLKHCMDMNPQWLDSEVVYRVIYYTTVVRYT